VARRSQGFKPVLTHRYFWLGLLVVVGSLLGLYLVMNHVVMPVYTRQGAAVTVPEVRELSFEQASNIVEDRDLRPERRDQPFNPSLPRDAVVDQNPQPNASVKPGRRVYLYVNSGARQLVTVPDVLNQTEMNAKATLAKVGIEDVEVRRDENRSPNAGTVTRQNPSAGETVGAESRLTVWVSPGLGDETVTVPDVRGRAPVDARNALLEAELWVDPTRSVGGTITRQEPEAGEEVREGTEVRIYSEPLDETLPPIDGEEGSLEDRPAEQPYDDTSNEA
jgi:beta-lactam-binding protein with PASTA domain